MPQALPALGAIFTAATATSTLATVFASLAVNAVLSLAARALGTSGTDPDGTTWHAVDYDA